MHWTEEQVIREIHRVFPDRPEIAPRGIGDDCAWIRDDAVLITTDASIEGVHFDLNWMSAADAVWRCMASNVSDVAAMGAFAGPFTLALGLPPTLAFDDIASMIGALKSCIEAHGLDGCWIVGGDVVRAPVLTFSVTVLGIRPPWPIVMRRGARPGNLIAVLGHCGYAAAGLDVCQKFRDRIHDPLFEPFIRAFFHPVALTQLGPAFAQNHLVTAMMDTSDGVRTDLPRLIEQSQCGAKIHLDAFVPDEPMKRAANELDGDPIDWMTSGGEDFGLLVTCEREKIETLKKMAQNQGVPCRIIGECTEERGVQWLEKHRISTRLDRSFRHFDAT